MQDTDSPQNLGDQEEQSQEYQESREEEPMLQVQELSLTVAEVVTCRTLRESGEGGPERPT
jgi:hypothetical protein